MSLGFWNLLWEQFLTFYAGRTMMILNLLLNGSTSGWHDSTSGLWIVRSTREPLTLPQMRQDMPAKGRRVYERCCTPAAFTLGFCELPLHGFKVLCASPNSPSFWSHGATSLRAKHALRITFFCCPSANLFHDGSPNIRLASGIWCNAGKWYALSLGVDWVDWVNWPARWHWRWHFFTYHASGFGRFCGDRIEGIILEHWGACCRNIEITVAKCTMGVVPRLRFWPAEFSSFGQSADTLSLMANLIIDVCFRWEVAPEKWVQASGNLSRRSRPNPIADGMLRWKMVFCGWGFKLQPLLTSHLTIPSNMLKKRKEVISGFRTIVPLQQYQLNKSDNNRESVKDNHQAVIWIGEL